MSFHYKVFWVLRRSWVICPMSEKGPMAGLRPESSPVHFFSLFTISRTIFMVQLHLLSSWPLNDLQLFPPGSDSSQTFWCFNSVTRGRGGEEKGMDVISWVQHAVASTVRLYLAGYKNKPKNGGREIDQSVKCLLQKHEELSLDPQHHCKK